MATDLSSAPPYAGNPNVSYTSKEEALAGKGPEGQDAPEGATPVAVTSGDTISGLMAQAGLDWNNPEHRAQFLRDNPQFADAAGRRNPDLIWPGEVLYIRTPGETPGQPGETDGVTDQTSDGVEGSSTLAQASANTDGKIEALDQARNANLPPGLGGNTDYQTQAVFDAIQGEIETGLREYLAANPDATPAELRAEANRLAAAIQGRSQTAASFDDASMDFRTQQALNNVSAEQAGIDLGRVAPGTEVRDGPYTGTSGPFEPGSTITLKDGSTVAIDGRGSPYPGGAGEQALRPNPGSVEQAQSNVGDAVDDVVAAEGMPETGPTAADKPAMVAASHTALGDAIQREIELRLAQWLEQNPTATAEEVSTQATAIGQQIREREGEVVPASTVEYRAEAAANAVNAGR